MNKLISVIVPVYNAELYLDECISSISNQTYQNLEIILVDDGATDRSGAICDDWATKDARIIVIHKQNGGISSARNAGLDIAKGEYIAFVDSDDILVEGIYECLAAEAEKQSAEIVVCSYQCVDDDGKAIESKHQDCETGIYTPEKYIKSIYKNVRIRTALVVAWNKIYSHNILKNVRYKENIIHEDEEIIHKLVLQSEKICVISERLYFYRIHEKSVIHQPISPKRFAYFYATRQRLLDCEEAGFAESTLRAIASDCVQYGVMIWLKIASAKLLEEEELQKHYIEIANTAKKYIKYGNWKQKCFWRCFLIAPGTLKFAYGMVKK